MPTTRGHQVATQYLPYPPYPQYPHYPTEDSERKRALKKQKTKYKTLKQELDRMLVGRSLKGDRERRRNVISQMPNNVLARAAQQEKELEAFRKLVKSITGEDI